MSTESCELCAVAPGVVWTLTGIELCDRCAARHAIQCDECQEFMLQSDLVIMDDGRTGCEGCGSLLTQRKGWL